jgi:4'-phosphopantetheinyl transferase
VLIRVLAVDLRGVIPRRRELAAFCSAARRDRADRYVKPRDAVACLAGEVLVRAGLAQFGYRWGLAHEWRIDTEGRPFLEDCPLDFNVSHSERYVVCAVSPGRVGIDVESVTQRGPAFARRILSDEEWSAIALPSGAPADADVCRLWTLKEAYLKTVGIGLRRSPSLTAMYDESGVLKVTHLGVADEGVEFHTQWLDDLSCCSVCAPPGADLILERVQPEDLVTW